MSCQNIHEQLQELRETAQRCEALAPLIAQTAQLLVGSLRGGGKILTCGNGGSAADAMHLAEELIGRYRRDRRPLPAICLNADVTAITCIANDYGFTSVYARQLQALGQRGDVLVCLSTSGNSANILQALELAPALGVTSVLLCGGAAGKAAGMADHELGIPSSTGARIQELHTFVIHQWLEAVDATDWESVTL